MTCAPHSVAGPWPSWTPPVTDFFSQSFVRLVAKSGLPAIRLHDLRHTHATFLKAGVPVKVVSERLGHATSAFTMTAYQHVLPGMQAEAANTFGEHLRRAQLRRGGGNVAGNTRTIGGHAAPDRDTAVTTIDITADMNDENETGLVWTFLDDARERSVITPGAAVVVGTPVAPAMAEVVNLVDKPAGTVVHLRLLPGEASNYVDALDR